MVTRIRLLKPTIEQFLDDRNMTFRTLAAAVKLHPTTLSKHINGHRDVDMELLSAIAFALSVRPEAIAEFVMVEAAA